ncbi:MAG: glycosyl transferase [Candidatus Levyibacteriota bacterium]
MTGTLHVFTSAAVNYLPKVRILCRSIRRHHPEAVIHLALADRRPDWLVTEGEPFDEVLDVSQLGIPDWYRWSFTHNIVELATAIKPFALARLLDLPDCGSVVYFDPDIVLFSRVDDILATLGHASIALTPHQNKPERTLESVLDNEVASLKHGIFNLGFVGVANCEEGKRFAKWWGERTYELCRADVPNGLFTDQKWVNFAPVFFDGVAIVKSSRHNVATWNLTTRELTGSLESGFRVDGEPLGFYHFTGFDSGAHRIMAIKNAATSAAVQELIGWYERETEVADHDPISKTPWAFGRYSDGTPIAPWHRWLYRDRADLRETFADPYDASSGTRSFALWCATEGRLLRGQYDGAGSMARPLTIGVGGALQLLRLAASPRAGRALRARVHAILRAEGVGGISRRLARRKTP